MLTRVRVSFPFCFSMLFLLVLLTGISRLIGQKESHGCLGAGSGEGHVWRDGAFVGVPAREAMARVSPGLSSVESDVHRKVSVDSPPAGAVEIEAGARSAGVTEGWLGKVMAQIELEEYEASVNERGLQAPNRAHNLRTYFEDDGIKIVPRTGEAEGTWSFEWRTLRWGREGELVDLASGGNSRAADHPAAATPVANGCRVTYDRGEIEEWYENRKEGLEQGFVVRERPESEGLLCIEGVIGGRLRADSGSDGEAIDLVDEHGVRVLRYAELKVFDADGCEIPSYLRSDGDRVQILVDDAGAEYPLVIDPLLMSPSWTAESNQENAYFGCSVATAGDVNGDGYSDIIVGAYAYDNGQTDEGRAYVYEGSASGLSGAAAWTAESNQSSANFGYSVGTAGDVNGDGYSEVIVSAPVYDNGESNEGRAYVYHGSASGLAGAPSWTAESNQAGAAFGRSVGTAGDVNGDGYSDVIVGAPGYDNGETDEGRAFVYHGSASGLAGTPAWTAESNQESAWLGRSVGTAGDVNGDGYSDVIVGAYGYDYGESNEGRVFVYHGHPSGLSATPVWTPDSDQAGAYYGFSVATAGDVNGDGYSDVIVGSYGYDNGESNEGRAWVYHGSASGLSGAPAWTAESNQVEARFSYSVATAGDVNGDGYSDVIVGSYGYDNGQADEGRAYVYLGSASGLSGTAAWTAESNQAGAEFGRSVGTAGDFNGDGYSDVIVGAYLYDSGETDEGCAYVYQGSPSGLSVIAAWIGKGDWQQKDVFGMSVSTAGDVNGDGYSDVIVGAPGHWEEQGGVYVYYGSASGLSDIYSWKKDGGPGGVGVSVGTAGDVNGDGYSDVIVGSWGYAFVYYGSASGLSETAAWWGDGSGQYLENFGCSVGTAGDVNGDGYSDVIVGADYYDGGEIDEGRAYVYHGSASGLPMWTSTWTAESNQANAHFGSSVGTAGDINGDGYSDVIVGADYYDNGQADEGRAYVYLGSASGLSGTAAWTAESNQAGASFGNSVGTAGDVNGDGYSDVIVGADYYDNGQADEGRAYVYLGSASGLSGAAAWTAESNQSSAKFGYSVGTAGDVNGDGYSEVIVSAPVYNNGEYMEGRAYVYEGSASGLSGTAAWAAESDQMQAYFGCSVGTAGDVNGDGYSDVIVGAYGDDGRSFNEGCAYVYYGNDGGGLNRTPRQAQGNDSSPIALLGLSESGLRLKAAGRTPAGRGNVQLQYEIKPLGVAFDGSGLMTGPAYDTGAPLVGSGSSVDLSALVSSLTPNTVYHWRLRILTDSPFFPRSPWFSMAGNGMSEADVRVGNVTGVGEEETVKPVPVAFIMSDGAPNPFGASMQLRYTLFQRGHVRFAVYDVSGRQVALLRDGVEDTGPHAVVWDGKGVGGEKLASGVYFARLTFGGRGESRKIVLIR